MSFHGLVKENMIYTKSAHVLVVHITKMIIYGVLGALTLPCLGYGLVIGIAAAPANWIGMLVLQKIGDEQFRNESDRSDYH